MYTQNYHDDTAIYGTEYEYYVTAIYDIGESNPSNTIVIDWNFAIDEPPIANVYAGTSFPNPFNPAIDGSISIKYFTNKETHNANIKVYNVKGEFVRTLHTFTVSQGMIETTWDGKDNNGNIVPSGVYLYSVDAEHNKFKKILLLR